MSLLGLSIDCAVPGTYRVGAVLQVKSLSEALLLQASIVKLSDATEGATPISLPPPSSSPQSPTAEAPTAEAPAPTAEAPRRRRRATEGESAAPLPAAAAESQPTAEATNSAPVTGRRRRYSTGGESAAPLPSASTAAETPATAPSSSGASATGRRRRSTSSEDTTTAAASSAGTKVGEVSNTDLTKACSDAAEKITPGGVKKVIEKFKVKSLGDLTQDQRHEFLGDLRAAVNRAPR